MPKPPAITGLIIAGGLARRMRGVDKGLQKLHGQTLLSHVITRLAPQVDQLCLNANHHHEAYAPFGLPLITDQLTGYAGPLAGLQAGLVHCNTPLLMTAPCDTPFFPTDLVARLFDALGSAQVAVASCAQQGQPIFALYRRETLDALNAFLAKGERKIETWQHSLNFVSVPFADARAFANINTFEELQQLENS